MENDDQLGTDGIYYALLLAAKVIEGVHGFPDVGEPERRAMLELVAVTLMEQARVTEATHASE